MVEHLPPSGKPHPLTRDSDFRPTRNVRKTAIGSFRGSAAGREPAIHNHGSGSMDSGARFRFATAPQVMPAPRCYHPGAIRRYTLHVLRITLRRFSPPQNPNLKRPTGSLKMNMQTKMQDIVGLTKIAPLSRRGFMTASAASAAGFTLAAGPVRADAIKTDTA